MRRAEWRAVWGATLLTAGVVCAVRGADAAPDPAGAGGGAVVSLPDVVVTGSRTARDLQSEPSAVYRLGADEGILREANRTTPNMLEGIPSAMVQGTRWTRCPSAAMNSSWARVRSCTAATPSAEC
jgi:outer membrane receptor protein involved in Fe transport